MFLHLGSRVGGGMMEEWSAPEAPADQNAAGDIWQCSFIMTIGTPFSM